MRKHLVKALMLGGVTMLVAGCTTYYRVSDPYSGKEYYTTEVGHKGEAVKFKDAKTQSMVTLRSSEVKEISKDEYKAGMLGNAPTKPAPVQPVPEQPAAAPSAEPAGGEEKTQPLSPL